MMYEAFYGLNEKPFAVPPDPAFLYLSEKHKKALSRLQYSILNQAAFTVISGEIGSGKTTIIRELMHSLDDDVAVGLVSNVNFSTFEELMQWILFAFELDYNGKDKVGLFDTFTNFVVNNYAENRKTVLIIDEAQNLALDILEQLRMLSNINVDQHQVLQLILVGQPGLLDTLKRPELEQFAQRIEVDYFLHSLDLAETTHYIKHRLRVAGGSDDIFTADAYPLIWRSTSGIPRLINILCGMALVYGFADLKEHIDSNIINQVLEDKDNGVSPLHGNAGLVVGESPIKGRTSSDLHLVNLDQKHASDKDKEDRKNMSTIEKLFFNNNE